ncbi:hypothetical protein CEXT_594651 [Caerostris extrusa]|uniref:Uncharacterized protein n=1 Tax=Caerostris extrusa TaxID=172846 RepID=A0AAV4NWP6_CAEEX|nr:hypothetical protein CEXT_594651 [Caerostris extrusa]
MAPVTHDAVFRDITLMKAIQRKVIESPCCWIMNRLRKVLYLADEEGFRTIIRTNEPGTKSSNPAGVDMEYSLEIRRQFQNIAQESIASLFSSVFGSSSQGPLVNPFSGPTGITSPSGSDLPSERPQNPPVINGKGPVFTAPKNAAAHSPHFNPGFRPGATYSQECCRILHILTQVFDQVQPILKVNSPSLNQLPGFLSPKGSNSLPGSDYPPQRPPVINGSNSLPDSDYPPQRPPVINGKGPVFTATKNAAAHSPHFNPGFRPGATYSQGQFPSLNQLPGFLSPKGSNSLPGSDYPPQRPPVINGKGPVFTAPKNAAAHSPILTQVFDQVQPILKVNSPSKSIAWLPAS